MRAARGLGAMLPRKLKGLKGKNPAFGGEGVPVADTGKKPGPMRKALRAKPGRKLTKP